MASDLSLIVAEENGQIESMYPKGSFQRVFWEQQREAATKKGRSRAKMAPPDDKVLCLSSTPVQQGV